MLIKVIDDSKVPLSEEESKFSLIKSKVSKGIALTDEEHLFLEKIVSKAEKWEAGVKSSKNTDPNDTMSG
jgi:hypothetical protein